MRQTGAKVGRELAGNVDQGEVGRSVRLIAGERRQLSHFSRSALMSGDSDSNPVLDIGRAVRYEVRPNERKEESLRLNIASNELRMSSTCYGEAHAWELASGVRLYNEVING